jgi:hypothetical protein
MKNNEANLYNKFKIKNIFLPKSILDETEKHLKEHGNYGNEGMVLWSGVRTKNHQAFVKSYIHPFQHCTAVSYEVPLSEAQRLNILLEQKKEVIIAQIHSHPGIAYHSGIDDQFPVTFKIGFFSVVVPRFCENGLNNLISCSVWEYIGHGKWSELSADDVKTRFLIT